MTRNEFHQILSIPFVERKEKGLQTFEWEHCAKAFQWITKDLAMKHLMEMGDRGKVKHDDSLILKCKTKSSVYYFGVGLKDCDSISLKKLKELYQYGVWYVYTWTN